MYTCTLYTYMYMCTLAPPPTQPTPLQPAGPTPPEGPPLPALSSLRALLPSTEGSPRHDPGSLQHPSAQCEEEAEQAELADVQHHACRVPLTAPLLVPPPLQNLLSQGHPLTSPTPQHHTAVSSLLRSVTRLVYTGFNRQDTEGGRERGRGREWERELCLTACGINHSPVHQVRPSDPNSLPCTLASFPVTLAPSRAP